MWRRSFALSLLLALPPAIAWANSIKVTQDAALNERFGLQVILDDPAHVPPTEAWVAIGPGKGLRDETAIQGSFVIDPAQLIMMRKGGKSKGAPPNPAGHLCFLSLSQEPTRNGERVILFLEAGPRGSWFLGARVWDDASQKYVVAGKAKLDGGSAEVQEFIAAGVDFEWGAAQGAKRGYIRVFQTVDEERRILFERDDLDNRAQAINYMHVGVLNKDHHRPGTFGELYLDGFELNRERAVIDETR